MVGRDREVDGERIVPTSEKRMAEGDSEAASLAG